MKKINLFVHLTLGFLIKTFAFFKGQRIVKKCKIKGPAVVLSNHTSFYDFIYTAAALYPRRVTYLAASKMFYEPLTGFFLRLARAIPKSLMQSDPVATLKAFRMLKKNGIVSIFPEGQISPSNRSLVPAFSIAKFLKKASADIYMVKHMGAGLANPPWSKYSFKGRIETVKSLIISKEDLKDMTQDEIYQVVKDQLFYSASMDNIKKQYPYKVKPIDNLENVIYQCPKCLYEGLKSHQTKLICPSCNHTLHYDVYGLLNGEGLDVHFLRQEARVRAWMDDHQDFSLSGQTKLMSFRHKKLVIVGAGILTIFNNQYIYQGTMDDKDVMLSFHASSIPSLPSDIGRNVQIYEADQIYQFEMDVPWLPTKMVHVGEYMFLKYQQTSDI